LNQCFAGKLSCPVAIAQGGRDHKLVPGSVACVAFIAMAE
jgi:hypothetical protein